MTAKLAKPRTRAPGGRIKVYRVSRRDVPDGHQGYSFATTQAGARRLVREFMSNYPTRADRRAYEPRCDVDTFEVLPTREGIIAALNRYASHAENG